MSKTSIKQFPRVNEILPKGESFHEPKGPIIWLTKKHLQKIEHSLQSFEDLKKNMDAVKKVNKTLEKLKQKIIEITNQ